MFKQNVGIADRTLRITIGLALLGTYFYYPALGHWALIGLIPLATGLFGTCGLYSLLGFSTCSIDNKKTG